MATSTRSTPTENIRGIGGENREIESDVGAAIAAMEALHGTELVTIARGDPSTPGIEHVLIVPKGMTVQSIKPLLDEYLAKPERRRGTAALRDALSFIGHIQRFSAERSAVFVNPDRARPTFTVVYDYHPEGPNTDAADWLQHRAVYAPDLSDQWKVWLAQNGKPMGQAEFAQFIEDHITDVIVPNYDDPDLKTYADLVGGRFAEPSQLVELSRGLQISVDSTVKQAVTLSTGEIAVQYEEVHRDGGGQPISVPNLFQVCIPVFYAGVPYRLAARLRYRRVGAALQWSFLLVRPELAFDDAIKEVQDKIGQETDAAVFLGSPEAAS